MILEIAKKMLKKYPLCDHCLGRQFALLIHGLDNKTRGESIKIALALEAHRLLLRNKREGIKYLKMLACEGFYEQATKTLESLGIEVNYAEKRCYICENVFKDLDEFTKKTVETLSKYEFTTFLTGIKIPSMIEDKEDSLRAEFGIIWGESIKNEFSREIGKNTAKLMDKQVDYKKPDVVIVIEPFAKKIMVQVNPLFIYGRYRKFVRELSQSRLDIYKESVEELITIPVLEVTAGTEAILHAAGREDADTRVLGCGRPFIVEVKNPQKRNIDLKKLEEKINQNALGQIAVDNLKMATSEDVKRLKIGERTEKVYRMLIEFSGDISDQAIVNIEKTLSNSKVMQLMPTRGMRNKPKRSRVKYVYDVKVRKIKNNIIEMLIRCQSGLYIKELVSGNGERTVPNVSQIAGIPAKCIELDVLEVNGEK